MHVARFRYYIPKERKHAVITMVFSFIKEAIQSTTRFRSFRSEDQSGTLKDAGSEETDQMEKIESSEPHSAEEPKVTSVPGSSSRITAANSAGEAAFKAISKRKADEADLNSSAHKTSKKIASSPEPEEESWSLKLVDSYYVPVPGTARATKEKEGSPSPPTNSRSSSERRVNTGKSKKKKRPSKQLTGSSPNPNHVAAVVAAASATAQKKKAAKKAAAPQVDDVLVHAHTHHSNEEQTPVSHQLMASPVQATSISTMSVDPAAAVLMGLKSATDINVGLMSEPLPKKKRKKKKLKSWQPDDADAVGTIPMEALTSYDVVLGRGRGFFNLNGNLRMRRFIIILTELYIAADKKTDIQFLTDTIYQTVRTPGPKYGRFVKQDTKTKLFYEISVTHAKTKISHAFRDLHKKHREDGQPLDIAYSWSSFEEAEEEDLLIKSTLKASISRARGTCQWTAGVEKMRQFSEQPRLSNKTAHPTSLAVVFVAKDENTEFSERWGLGRRKPKPKSDIAVCANGEEKEQSEVSQASNQPKNEQHGSEEAEPTKPMKAKSKSSQSATNVTLPDFQQTQEESKGSSSKAQHLPHAVQQAASTSPPLPQPHGQAMKQTPLPQPPPLVMNTTPQLTFGSHALQQARMVPLPMPPQPSLAHLSEQDRQRLAQSTSDRQVSASQNIIYPPTILLSCPNQTHGLQGQQAMFALAAHQNARVIPTFVQGPSIVASQGPSVAQVNAMSDQQLIQLVAMQRMRAAASGIVPFPAAQLHIHPSIVQPLTVQVSSEPSPAQSDTSTRTDTARPEAPTSGPVPLQANAGGKASPKTSAEK